MKQRVLVMNGQRLLQNEQGGQWATSKVDKAGAIKPGIYDIYLAQPADKARTYDGVILHADGASVYQQVGKTLIKHAAGDFAKVPGTGIDTSVSYEEGQAHSSSASVKQERNPVRSSCRSGVHRWGRLTLTARTITTSYFDIDKMYKNA